MCKSSFFVSAVAGIDWCADMLITALRGNRSPHLLSKVHTGGMALAMVVEFEELMCSRLGLIMMCVGEMGNFTSFSFAPASLVAPLGCVSVLSNIIVGHFLLKERLRIRDVIGIGVSIISATGIVIIAPSVRCVLVFYFLS